MPDTVFVSSRSGSSPVRSIIFDRAGIIGHSGFVGERRMSSSNPIRMWLEGSLTPSEIRFIQQEQAFERIPPLLLAQYQGEFVVSRDGEIVDHDNDLPTLTDRFFSRYADVPVYIAKVGEKIRVKIRTPFFD